jgi:LemA protein
MLVSIVLVSSILVFLILIWSIYNRLVSAKNIVHEAFSGIDVQLKKRYELIPNLIEAVKGYNAYEAQVLQDIVTARSASGGNVNEMSDNDASITGALRQFRLQVEAYPDLKANVQFLDLMKNLSAVENELAMARRYYNGAVRDLNTKIQLFPAVLFAGVLGFKAEIFYKVDDDQREAHVINLKD